MCGFIKTVAQIAAPIVGFALGGPAGAALAGGIAGGLKGGRGTLRNIGFGALGGYLGGSALASGGLVGGQGFGAFADSAGTAISNMGSNISSGVGSLFGGAAEAAGPYAGNWTADPIQLMSQLDTFGGGMGAEAGAQSLGYGTVEDALANAGDWVGGGANVGAFVPAEVTPDATFGGMASQWGNGVTSMDMLKAGGRMLPGGTMNAGSTGSLSPWSLAQGAYGLYESQRLKKLSEQMALQADPNAPYRAGYAARLNALTNDPSSITSVPGYDAGLQAVQRSAAAQGYQGSGNMMAALSKFGGDFYNQEVQRLATLSGAAVSPAVGPTLRMAGNINALNLAGQSIGVLSAAQRRAQGQQQLAYP